MNLTNRQPRYIILIVVASLCAVSSGACRSNNATPAVSANANSSSPLATQSPRLSPPPPSPSPSQSPSDGYNMNAPITPDSQKTPGDALDVTRDDICVPGYAKKVRNVPQAVKEEAYREYGITSRLPREYEVYNAPQN